ncbi:hypothetical protein AJ78_04086 [Emergomyces pasteurianus Ep9510]|uniref:Myb-like DNA-binding domain-containing protein n=1 Tax=Emergomyces pasteurianus Ep9510 TaxID=1447872 RepID=A0A1J9QIF1_9EURO|nr:hypothetical protein AJ78_04086 [Emergomyces pasteurianus Ep9510]
MPANSEEQLNFLLKCVKYTSNGRVILFALSRSIKLQHAVHCPHKFCHIMLTITKSQVNFDEVAKECNIITKAAAAKRYERLMKANGITPNGGPASRTDASSPPEASSNGTILKNSKPQTPTKSRSTAGTKTPSVRKRKITVNANGTSKKSKGEKSVDDSDDTDGAGGKTHVKSEDGDDNIFDGEPGETSRMKSSNDPLLSEGFGAVEGDLGREDGELYNEFCAINRTTKHGGSAGSGNNGGYTHGSSDHDITGDENGEQGMMDRGDEA